MTRFEAALAEIGIDALPLVMVGTAVYLGHLFVRGRRNRREFLRKRAVVRAAVEEARAWLVAEDRAVRGVAKVPVPQQREADE